MSTFPGNPCGRDKEGWTFGTVKETCRDCGKKFEHVQAITESQLVQGRCRLCHENWMEEFLTKAEGKNGKPIVHC